MLNPIFLSGALLGWGLGANDAANIFGTAVYTKVISYRRAVILIALFAMLGAWLEGGEGLSQLGDYAYLSGVTSGSIAFFVMLAAGVTVIAMTMLKLPVSTSQAVLGAILGSGVFYGRADFSATTKFFGAWVLTPIGGGVIAFILYYLIVILLEKKIQGFKFFQVFVRLGYYVAGIFGAYALGANNVANVTAIYTGQIGLMSKELALLIGGISIALGALTFSKPVMSTVGEKIVPMSPVSGFVVVLAAAITVYIYARIGIPVSTSQAVVGAIIGVGFHLGIKTINLIMLRNIMIGWIGTPTLAGVISFILANYHIV